MREIKLIDEPSQTFSVVLNGKRCRFHFRYNDQAERWTFSLAIDEVVKLHGRFVVLERDLVAPFNLGIGAIYAVDYTNNNQEPKRSEIPSGVVRIYQHAEGDSIVTSV